MEKGEDDVVNLQRRLGTIVGAAALVASIGIAAHRVDAQTAQKPLISTLAQRKQVSVTIYNDGFGLVREVREIPLGTGRVSLEVRDVSGRIQPETVSIKGASPTSLKVYEQNYRYDLLNPQTLLAKYVGKHVKLYRWNGATGMDDVFDAKLLSINDGTPVYEVKGEITHYFPGRVTFPEVPPDLIPKPTLVWLLDSTTATQKVEVTYLSSGFGWRADYVLSVDQNDALADLQGWVTLNNTTGTSYEQANLQLVAGDVHKVAADMGGDDYKKGVKTKVVVEGNAIQFKEEGLFEYHLYTLNTPTTILDNEQKQVSLLEGKGVKIKKRLIFRGDGYYFRSKYGGAIANDQKVGVFLDIENKEANHLGMPLPKGTVRVYKADKSGAKQFIGEDAIDHTPRDEKIRVKMGDAFDVVADRKQTDWKPLGSCVSESAFEIAIRNHKDVAEEVELVEPAGGDWEILSSSLPATKVDQNTFTFKPKIAAKGETKVTYRVRVRWC